MKRVLRWLGGLIGAFALLIMVLAIFDHGSSPTSTSPAPSQRSSASVTTSARAAQPALTNARWSAVTANPRAYVGRHVALTGQFARVIAQTQPALGSVVLDPQHGQEDVAVQFPAAFAVAPDEYVAIQGTLQKIGTFTNAFGAVTPTPIIVASSAHLISRDAAVDPTVKTLAGPAPQTQNGLTLAVTRVEIASRAIRVFLHATNHGGGSVLVADYAATLTQGTQQLAVKASSPDLALLPAPIATGATVSGELVFHPTAVTGGSFVLTVSALGDTVSPSWQPFRFLIP